MEAALGRRPGVGSVDANPVAQTATISYDPTQTSVAELAGWVRDCGYPCAGQSVPAHVCDPLIEPTGQDAHSGDDSHSGLPRLPLSPPHRGRDPSRIHAGTCRRVAAVAQVPASPAIPNDAPKRLRGMCGTLTSLSDGHSGQWRACNALTVSCAATASNSAAKRIPDSAGGMASAR